MCTITIQNKILVDRYVFRNIRKQRDRLARIRSRDCRRAFSGVAVELMRALNFYSFSNQNSHLNDIWLCGGGAGIAELRNAIGEAIDMKLHPAKELVRNGDSIEHCYSLIQAIGAAQY